MNREIFKKIDFLPLFAICFCLGICLERWRHIPFLFLYTGAWMLLVLAGCLLDRNKSSLILLLLGFILGGLLLANSQILEHNHISRFTPYKSRLVFIQGVVIDDPVCRPGNISFTLKVQRLKTIGPWQGTSGKILVKAFVKQRFAYGDRLLLEGKLYRPFYLRIGERLNYRDYLRRQGIYSILSAGKVAFIKRLAVNQGNPFVYFIFKLRHRLKEIINNNLSHLSSSVLSAVILGERQYLPEYVRDALVNSGTVHVIAISGLHLGIVAFMVLAILRILRLSKRARYIITIFISVFYCILTGARTPVVRATIMAAVLLIGYILRRQANIYNCLSLAALIILAANPQQIFQLSFQFSFISIISIVCLAPKIGSVFGNATHRKNFPRVLINIFSVSLAAWLGLLPLIAYNFRLISPVAILANIIVVPFMTVVIASGFTFLVTAFFCQPLNYIFSMACEGSILALLAMISSFLRLPFAYFKPTDFPFYKVLLYYLLLSVLFYALQIFQRQKIVVQ